MFGHGIEVSENPDHDWSWEVRQYGSFVEAVPTKAQADEYATHLAGELDAYHEQEA
jgi:hypothetical protein